MKSQEVTQNAVDEKTLESDHSDSDDEKTGRKRVGFEIEDDVCIEDEDLGECRLQRKDTPHHLKGKRITADDDGRLQDILLAIRQKSEEHENDEEDEHDVSDGAAHSRNGVEDETLEGMTDEQLENKKKG